MASEYVQDILDSNGNVIHEVTFKSEPIGLPAEEGYGWPCVLPDELIGPSHRYKISRKLGWGGSCSVWLARDEIENEFVSIKILNGYHTSMVDQGFSELDVLKKISEQHVAHCLILKDSFIMPGKGTSGKHLCLVTQLLGGDTKYLKKHNMKEESSIFPFPIKLAKRILLHVLRGIAHAHACGVVHTDLKMDNVFFNTTLTTSDIEKLLESDPVKFHPPQISLDGTFLVPISQPLPPIFLEEACSRTFILGDFGNAHFVDSPSKPSMITSREMRPPEAFIGGPWNEKADIWAYGCLIYKVIIGKNLFIYGRSRRYNLDEVASMLHQMICFTGDWFEPEQLRVSRDAGRYFNTNCSLLEDPDIFDYPFETSMKTSESSSELLKSSEDMKSTADLMRRCLRLDPANRASAEELLRDHWFADVE